MPTIPPTQININVPDRPEKQKTKKITRKHFWYWSLVVIAAAGALTLVLVNTLKPEPEEEAGMGIPVSQKPVIKDTLPEGYMFTVAPAGQYPAGFPKDLVLVKNPEILRGEDTIVGSGDNQKIVDLLVEKPAAEIFSLYNTEMPKKGWENIMSKDEEVKSLGFKKGDNQFYVTILSKSTTTSQVNLTYVVKK